MSNRLLWCLIVLSVINVCRAYFISKGIHSNFRQSNHNPLIPSTKAKKCHKRSLSVYDTAQNGLNPADDHPVKSSKSTASSDEEKLSLDYSFASKGFLKNIEEYGKARMARRAVGILSKMPAYKEMPKQEHYTAVIWACENSDQFKLAMSVFGEMKAANVNRVVKTYEGLISVAEKTQNWEAGIKLFEEMIDEGLIGSTESYNSCIWAAEQGGRHDISLKMLNEMEKNEVPRSQSTYAACAYSCEKAGQGEIALHVMDLMKKDGYNMDTPMYKAVIWACVKAGMWDKSLELFEQMELDGKLRDEDCYSGAIWACFSGSQWEKAVGFMKLMKFEGLERKTIAYDGALSALQAGGQWDACLDMLTWMDRENPITLKSKVTYQVVLQALDDAGKEEEMIEIYQRASRDNYFIPWVKGSRLADVRGYTLSVAKIAIRNILLSMKEGKLAFFNLHVAVCDAPQPEEWSSQMKESSPEPAQMFPSFDLQKLEDYLLSLEPLGLLDISRIKLEGTERIVLSRESLAAWSLSSPFYGYDDTRNQWIERQTLKK